MRTPRALALVSVILMTTACASAKVSAPTPGSLPQSVASQKQCVMDTPAHRAGYATVKLFFACRADPGVAPPHPVLRQIPGDQVDLGTAVAELLKGPTEAERSAGFDSYFSSDTAPLLHSVQLKDAVATVDFGDLPAAMANASTAAGSYQLLQELGRTIAQFEAVESIEYRLNGSCEQFFAWLQGSCHQIPAQQFR